MVILFPVPPVPLDHQTLMLLAVPITVLRNLAMQNANVEITAERGHKITDMTLGRIAWTRIGLIVRPLRDLLSRVGICRR